MIPLEHVAELSERLSVLHPKWSSVMCVRLTQLAWILCVVNAAKSEIEEDEIWHHGRAKSG